MLPGRASNRPCRAGDEAVRALERALGSRKQPSAEVRCFLAMTHWQLGNRDEARKWLNGAEDAPARSSYANLFLEEARSLVK